jgi:hypothetical protein
MVFPQVQKLLLQNFVGFVLFLFSLVKNALDVPKGSFPQFLWNELAANSMEEEQMQKTIQITLTDFVGKCNRPQLFEPKHERTFWIDKIIPIFQAIGDQTGLIGFEWCENVQNHSQNPQQT